MRSHAVSRLYLQVPPGEPLENWPDDRIWTELNRRFKVDGSDWSVSEGRITDKSVTPMRSFPVIKDLVTDVSFNYDKARTIPSFAPPAPGLFASVCVE